MDGIEAMRAVLIADAALTALVPAASIAEEPLPLDTVLPAIGLQSISKVDLNIPSPGLHRFVRERVQVSVKAENAVSRAAILKAVRRAAADKINPTIPGLVGVTIHTDSAGPNLYDQSTSSHRGSQDFRITYSELR